MGDARHIDVLAARQYGVFNLRQTREAGFDKSAVRRRLDSGAWIQLDHRVYCLASAPPKWERRLAAAVLSRSRAVLTGNTAAHLHELKGFGRGRPVILVARSSNIRSRIARVIETSLLDQTGTTRIAGFEATTVPETILVLARDLTRARIEAVFDDALLSRKLDLTEFNPILNRESGRRTPGMRVVRELVADRGPTAPTKSSTYLEALLERALHQAPIPPWTREYPFTLGDHPARVDVFVADWRLVVEADGRSWHMRNADFDRDRRRDNELATRGIQVLRFSYSMLSDDPEDCVAKIVATGSVRAASGFG